MRTLQGLFLVARHAFAGGLKGRRAVALLLLAALPVGLAFLQVRFANIVTASNFMAVVLLGYFQVVVPFAGLFLGVSVLGDEIEGRTVSYLFTRPVPRWAIYLGRLVGSLAGFSLVFAGSVVLCTALYRGRADVRWVEAGAAIGIGLLGLLAYGSIFAALRIVLERALFIGFLMGAIVEGAISKMPVSGLSKCSIWHHMALLQTRTTRVAHPKLREFLQGLGPEETVEGSLWVLAGIILVAIKAGVWLVRTREIRVPAAVA